MAKKKAEKPRRKVTKRQLSRWQQQKRRQRIILGLGVFVIVAVLVIVGAGWYISQYQPLHQTAIKVNNTEFNMKYYVEMLKLHGAGQSTQFEQYQADNVVKSIEQNALIRQGALKLGVRVSDDALKEELKNADLPNNDVQRDLIETLLVIEKLLDKYFEEQVPTSAEQRQVMAMLLEGESQATEVRTRLEDGESFAELAEGFSLSAVSKNNKGDFGWHPKGLLTGRVGTSIPEEHAFNSEVGALSQPIYDEEIYKEIGYWLIKVLDKDEEAGEAQVQAILLGNAEEAQAVRNRLEAGEDFAALAKEFSQFGWTAENGGDLGSIAQGEMSPAPDKFIFSSQVEAGILSEPIRDETVATKGGYWLVKVVDKDDNRQIEAEDRDLLKSKALDTWIVSLWDDPENRVDDSYLDDEKKAWAIEQVVLR